MYTSYLLNLFIWNSFDVELFASLNNLYGHIFTYNWDFYKIINLQHCVAQTYNITIIVENYLAVSFTKKAMLLLLTPAFN